MTQPEENGPKAEEEIPRFRILEKKVDSGWKAEIAKERAAARAEELKTPAQDSGPDPSGPRPARTPPKVNELFLQFTGGLVQQAMMQLGMVENPFAGGRRTVDLEGAREAIDILLALQEKTQGNLAPKEEQIFTHALRELQAAYVQMTKKVAQKMKEKKK